jgi:hypothetical protein
MNEGRNVNVENEKGTKMKEGEISKVGPEMKVGGEIKASTRIRAVRWVYALLAISYLVCVVLQVFLAGMGILVNTGDLQWHRVFANYFELGSLLMFLLSFFGRIRGSLRWLTLGLFALTSLQHLTIQNFSGSLRALHTIDALILFAISMHVMRRSWPWLLLRTENRAKA